MRNRAIVRVVDALASQQRIIVWLECKHTVTITTLQAHDMTAQEVAHMKPGNPWPCPHCPDPPPPTAEDLRRLKTAQQLYREAGEP